MRQTLESSVISFHIRNGLKRGALLPPPFTDAEADPAKAHQPGEPPAEFAMLMIAVHVEMVGMRQNRQDPTTSLKLEKADGAA